MYKRQSEEVRNFKADPAKEMRRHFPTLESVIGSFRVCPGHEAYTTRYYRLDPAGLRRTVLAADAYQSVNPANGVGISKCLTDARVITDCLPHWLEQKVGAIDTERYYRDARKQRIDDEALRRWRWATESSTSRSLVTRVKRLRIATSMAVRRKLKNLKS
mgnify:CR=1 FL=1